MPGIELKQKRQIDSQRVFSLRWTTRLWFRKYRSYLIPPN